MMVWLDELDHRENAEIEELSVRRVRREIQEYVDQSVKQSTREDPKVFVEDLDKRVNPEEKAKRDSLVTKDKRVNPEWDQKRDVQEYQVKWDPSVFRVRKVSEVYQDEQDHPDQKVAEVSKERREQRVRWVNPSPDLMDHLDLLVCKE